jgi:FtsP/CotA-like multicopper oxidase with cupredoxin domain
MIRRKYLSYILLSLVLVSLIFSSASQIQSVTAMPMSATDESKVPHYFGPNPNWANSPFTLPDVAVEITGDGAGATAVASVGANGAVTGITITDPGSGYTSATVNITGAGSGATAEAVVSTSGVVTSITVDAYGSAYTTPSVTLSGGGGTGTLVQVGNQLMDRAFASDYPVGVGVQAPVFVIVPTPLPSGTLTDFLTWNQAVSGGSDFPSAGNIFYAYVLRPTGIPNEFQVVFDSGILTVPALIDPLTSELAAFPVNVAVTAGDVLAFYGQGIPLDDAGTGSDILSYPAPTAPLLNSTITLGSADFPVFSQTRTYSFAANVIDTSGVVPLTDATATAYGGVDAVALTDPGSGYTFPTVDFDLPDDPNGVQPTAHALFDPISGAITEVVVDNPGSGYSSAPNVVIRDGTLFDPINNGGTGATASATLAITSIALDTYGAGYTSTPTVEISDLTGTGSGAHATAIVNAGAVTGIINLVPGTDYITAGGIKKFQDGLPVLCNPTLGWDNCTDNNLGQHIPIAVADTTTFPGADYYVIALVQTREQMNSSLPATGTLLREYVQLETLTNWDWSKHVALETALLDGTTTPTLMPDGSQAVAVDDPHFLGPIISATKDKPVRIVFYNLLPTGAEGDLFLPTDSSLMGSGTGPMTMDVPADNGSVLDGVRNPMCTEYPKMADCFLDNRATLHLHGGITPWISDGTPHQWITPANENTPYPQGVSVSSVPDMVGQAAIDAGIPDCSADNDGCMTFYYTNQQSARFMFYHDHAWGITRLNVYAGEAAGYLIEDPTEQALVANGIIPEDQIPLVIQDRTFVPENTQLYNVDVNGNLPWQDGYDPTQIASYGQDPTWDAARWGGYGDLWYHHVYMPAQNPGDPSGMSGYGRWMYGPWFWPPATPQHGPIANPYYDANCNLDDPATWQYQTDPFCEPQLIPGTPNISVGMEQFNDTPIVNGTAYPTTTVDPKSYRLRILNAANDRFWNLQWYVADPTTGTESEVALNPAELAAAQTDPNIFPTPDTSLSPAGPSWIQIGSEGGFLPAPVVVPNQPITWIIDPTRFDVGNVDKHSLLLAPAERADVIVDFSQYAGQTLILYNDAPAAFPARVSSYDYYTGAPDLSPAGAPTILPGYGPNTRTIMQVKVAATTPAPAFNLTALTNAFKHHADGSGVFEAGQNPIIVGQAAYNSAYGTNFAASSWCNAPGSSVTRCDGFARISDQGGDLFGFNTLRGQTTKMQIPLQPKAIHDEMNAVAFDEFGRMTANLGLEAVPATPGLQNIILYPFVNPQTELIDATKLPVGDINVTPIGTADDGTQIWKITHNGVDTHPIHFHLYDVQVLNRVTWDNIIIPTDATELGWKDTVRISPLEDTIVALRPIIPTVPFELPNSIRELNPMMPDGSTIGFNNMDAQGNPTNPIVNQLVNFGWEYVYHCHILSHEEMDMMRPVSVALPPNKADGLSYSVTGNGNNTVLTLTWNDNSINETAFVVQKSTDGGTTWADVGTVLSPLDQPNTHGSRSYADNTFRWNNTLYSYRVVAKNTIGYGAEFMSLTAQSESASVTAIQAPTNLSATLLAGPQVSLTWRDNATNETGFIIERSTDGLTFTQIGTAPARNNTGNVTYIDNTVVLGTIYTYRVATVVGTAQSPYSNVASITVDVPAAPSNVSASATRQGNNERVTITWTDNANNETGFTIQRATNATFTTGLVTTNVGANTTTYTTGNISRVAYYIRVRANNVLGFSAWVNATPSPLPLAP